jgi:hypothetical protein
MSPCQVLAQATPFFDAVQPEAPLEPRDNRNADVLPVAALLGACSLTVAAARTISMASTLTPESRRTHPALFVCQGAAMNRMYSGLAGPADPDGLQAVA